MKTILQICLTCVVFLSACTAEKETVTDTPEETAPAETAAAEPELSDDSEESDEIVDLILDGDMEKAIRKTNRLRFSLKQDSEPRIFFDNLYLFIVLEESMRDGKYDNAHNMYERLDSGALPEELIPMYEETASVLPALYEKWKEEHPAQEYTAKSRLCTEAEFKEYVDSLEEDLISRDFSSAEKTIDLLVENKTRWNTNSGAGISEKLIDRYGNLYWYADCIHDYNIGQYTAASGCFIGMERFRSELPEALQKQYDEYVKAADHEATILQCQKEWQSRKKKEESKKQYYSVCDDEYNACEYSDAEEFYYWNEDFFVDYEDAEEYWEKYH